MSVLPAVTTAERWPGGRIGNGLLTSATALLLTLLLLAEGVTIIKIGRLRDAHMFIGFVLIPPVLVKLASTAYRLGQYYRGAPPYRTTSPPAAALQILGGPLVAATLVVFGTGVILLPNASASVLDLHKLSFYIWAGLFGLHFLAHLPGATRLLWSEWRRSPSERVPGTGWRTLLLTASIGAGLGLALALLSAITGWHHEG